MNRVFLYSLFVLSLVVGVRADRLLNPDETETLLKQLTDSPRRQWLSQGKIQARHLEYYADENRVRESTETIYHDGSRMRLDVLLNEEQSTETSFPNSFSGQLNQDFKLNQSRIFLWDGQKSIQYYKSADYAVVTAGQDTDPMASCGPMTAGIVPWGYGDFTYWVLMSQSPKAYEQYSDNQLQIVLEYTNETTTPHINVTFVLDPSKSNAVLSYTIENELALLRQMYQGYLKIGDQWSPTKVLIERFDKRSGTAKLLSYEDWQFNVIDAETPSEDIFSVQYKNGTTVELHPAGGIKTFLYDASDRIDISTILADKISLLGADQNSVNCATAAIGYIARRFSKELQQENLAQVISSDTQKTTLYDMKKTLEEAGLNCMAVTTDLDTLGKIKNCEIILHLALTNHYVILDHLDSDGAWIIDLTNRQFFSKQKIDNLMQEWNNGTALLVSDTVITPPLDATFRYLEIDKMTQIQGGDFGTYSCTEQIQTSRHVLCSDAIGGFLCSGMYYIFEERRGCIEDENGGTCVGEKKISYRYSHCDNNAYSQKSCTKSVIWTSRYIRACE